MELTDRTWHLMARILNKEASPAEQEEWAGLLQADPSLQQQFDLLYHIWIQKDKPVADEENAKQVIRKIIDKAGNASPEEQYPDPAFSRRRRRRLRMPIAIATLAVLLTGAWVIWGKDKPASGNSTVAGSSTALPEALIVKNGSRSRFVLPDGTTAWLNAGSKLYYENDFTGATREVRLEGEAFFDVVKHPERPFIVHTSAIDIRVVGTAFNVKSYPEDKNVETTLYRGRVDVFRPAHSAQPPIVLQPNQKLILSKEAATDTEELSKQQTSVPQAVTANYRITTIDSTKKENERFETAWLYSRLECRGDSFEQLARKLERWYNVSILLTDEKVKHLSVNVVFENETIEQAFAALGEAFPIRYKITNNEISVGSSQ